jgi:hypothetical protein
MPTSRLACKQQLRGTGCRAGLRSDSTMKEVRARVQRKIFMGVISARAVTAVTLRRFLIDGDFQPMPAQPH